MPSRTAGCLLLAIAATGCGKSDHRGAADTSKTAAARGAPHLFAGGRRTCLVCAEAIRCWGDASHGSLGPAVKLSASAVPTDLPGIEGALEIAFGEAHGCARMPDGSVRCWGSNQ